MALPVDSTIMNPQGSQLATLQPVTYITRRIMTTLLKLGSCAIVAGALLSMTSATTPGGVSVGEEVSHDFRTPLLNGMGTNALSDLNGKPVLIEFWGTR
jgi:hypothetical protein